MKKIALLSLIVSSVVMAGGYKIPETSTNALALSAANIANNSSADAAYYNPANMVFMDDESVMEMNLMYIGLDKVNYKGRVYGTGPYDTNSKKESFIVPSIHYVSGKLGEARIGLSIVSPGGLSKRWEQQPAKSTAEEFSLELLEINPTIAIPMSDKVSFAVGFRFVHSSGVSKGQGKNPNPMVGVYRQSMTGDAMDYGYNLALAYQPTSNLDISVTYRSKIMLDMEGDADLSANIVPMGTYTGNLSVPLPATFSTAVSYTFSSDTTLELVYEKIMWSAYKSIDFNYGNRFAEGVFGQPKPKNWKDTNAYRLGFTQGLDDITIMAGMVYDESPVPNKTVGFELPDSDSFSVSLGGRYAINKKWDIGLSALYAMREKRTISAADMNDNGLVGEFSDGNVLIISTGVSYKF